MPYHSFIAVPLLRTASQPPSDRTIANIDATAVQQITAPVVFCITGPGLETAKKDMLPGLGMYGKHCAERTLEAAMTDTLLSTNIHRKHCTERTLVAAKVVKVLSANIHWKHCTERTLVAAKTDTLLSPDMYWKHCAKRTLGAAFKEQPAHADYSRRTH